MIKGNELDVGNIDLRYRLVLHCFWTVHISATRCQIEMGFRFKCSILNWQVIYVGKLKLNIADMCFIPLDGATYSAGYSWGFDNPLLLATPLELPFFMISILNLQFWKQKLKQCAHHLDILILFWYITLPGH